MGIEEKKRLEALVIKAKAGDMIAKEALANTFKKAIECKASRYFIKGLDRDDLISEGYRTLLIAINKYNPIKQCFYTYGLRAIENRLIDLLRVNKEDDEKKSISLTDEIKNFLKSDDMSIEDMTYYKLLVNKIDEIAKDEGEIIRNLYINGKTIKEIAIEKGASYSQIQYLRNKGLKSLRSIV